MAKSNISIINKSVNVANQIKKAMIISALDDIANKALDYAITNHEFNNQTLNLEDSYGYAIYVDGDLFKIGRRGQKAYVEDDRGGFGIDRAYEILIDHIPSSPYEVIVVAGEYYAATLEILYQIDVLTGAYQFTADYSKMKLKA